MDTNFNKQTHDSDSEQINSDKETGLFDSLEALDKEDNNRRVARWIKILLIIVGLQFIWGIISLSSSAGNWLSCENCSYLPFYLFYYLHPFIYVPVTGYLLYKRKRWGWILFFAYIVSRVFLECVNLFSHIYYWEYYKSVAGYLTNAITIVIYLLLRAGYIVLLWKPAVAAYYDISPRTKRSVLIAGIFIAFVMYILLILFPLGGSMSYN